MYQTTAEKKQRCYFENVSDDTINGIPLPQSAKNMNERN